MFLAAFSLRYYNAVNNINLSINWAEQLIDQYD
jgi:hypothetical protein